MRITMNSAQCGGRPCVRGMRIRGADILDLYAAGLTGAEILEEMPDLEVADLEAALRYAPQQIDRPITTPPAKCWIAPKAQRPRPNA
jgi:uncharacterized protein (DUF433 family)